MTRHVGRMVLLVVVILVAGGGAPGQSAPAAGPSIDELVRRLGSNRYSERTEAMEKLIELGGAALPAVRRAMLSDDLEVSARARAIHDSIVNGLPERLRMLRRRVEQGFRDGDYERMIAAGRALTEADPQMLDLLWLGHACQLAGQWREATAAYEAMLPLLDEQIARAKEGGQPAGGLPVGVLIEQRIRLAMWVGRLQWQQVNDPKAAARTLAKAAEFFPDGDEEEPSSIRLKILRDLAAAQQESGDVPGAFATWARLQSGVAKIRHGHPRGYLDIERLAAALGALPADKPLPEIPSLFVLTPQQPVARLAPEDPQTRRRSYCPSGNPDQPFWRYAFAAAPGMELAALEFACDIEQMQVSSGGQFRCFVLTEGPPAAEVTLGSVGWPRGKPAGREVVRATVNVPAGVKAVHVETGSSKDRFRVHDIQVKATLRPVSANPQPLQAQAWASFDADPPVGQFTCGGRQFRAGISADDVRPGKYAVEYMPPGTTRPIVLDLLVQPGRRYGLFVNPASPFRWRQAGPTGLNWFPPSQPNLAPLPGGGHLAVWCGRDNKIMLSRTKDFSDWTAPEPAAFNAVFDNISPSLLAARDGAVWVAFFSNRLSFQEATGFRLFLTSTRDGQTWSSLIPVFHSGDLGWPPPPACLVEASGRYWMYWKQTAASCQAIKAAIDLEPIEMPHPGAGALNLCNQQVTLDEGGTFHMVFDDFGGGIYHAASRDGTKWSAPTLVVDAGGRRGVSHGQLLTAGGNAALLYSNASGAYLTHFPPAGGPITSGAGLKITSHTCSLGGGRVLLTRDGQVLLLAGGDASWLLSAKLADIVAATMSAPVAGEPGPATAPASGGAGTAR